MVTKWILIAIFSGHSFGITADYHTQQACENAAEKLKAVATLAVCTADNTEQKAKPKMTRM